MVLDKLPNRSPGDKWQPLYMDTNSWTGVTSLPSTYWKGIPASISLDENKETFISVQLTDLDQIPYQSNLPR